MAEPAPTAPDAAADDAPTGSTDAQKPPTAADDAETWKKEARRQERAVRALEAKLTEAQQASMTEQERAVAEAKAEGRREALVESNRRLLHAEVRAAAANVLADPDDAVHLLDLESFEIDGDIDRTAIRSALDQLVKAKPYLSPQPGLGSGEGGPRGNPRLNEPLDSDPLLRDLKSKLGVT